MTVNQLRSLAISLNIDTSDCLDKQDMVEIIKAGETVKKSKQKPQKIDMYPLSDPVVSFANPLQDDEDVKLFSFFIY